MMTADNVKAIAIGAGVLGVVYLGYKTVTKGAQVAQDVAQAVNPLNNDNVFATTVNKVGGAVAGDDSGGWSLGGWIYDMTHADPMADTTPAPKERAAVRYDSQGNVTGVY